MAWDLTPFHKLAETGTGDALPAQEPQAEEDRGARDMHGPIDDMQLGMKADQAQEPETKEYKFFYGNGQLHVSPIHDHEELRGHSGTPADHIGPIGVGYVHVQGGSATWSVESNVALRGLVRVLEDYGKNVGWQWGGLVGGDGQPIHDDFGPKKSYWYGWKDGVQISERPWNSAMGRIVATGQRVALPPLAGYVRDGLLEWADDFGYRVSEYPGGTDMNDRIKNWEELNQYDKGDPDWEPEKAFDGEPQGERTCPTCDERLPNFRAYQLHMTEHEPQDSTEIENGHFPTLNDKDDVLPLRIRNVMPVAMPISSLKEARVAEGFNLYADVWNFDTDENTVFYGGYLEGKLAGYGVVRPHEDETELVMIHASVPKRGVGRAIAAKIMQHYPNLITTSGSPEGESLLNWMGMTNVKGQVYRLAAGQEGKDLIEAPLPFIYDIQQDYVTVGHPGQKTSDIAGQFTPGGIVEGYYEPGGKVIIQTSTTMPYSTYHLMQLWYYSQPHMEITSLELETGDGKTQKLAGTDIGTYLKTLAVTDPAVWNAYQALRQAGGHVYVVGGAVRDALLQKQPKDIDLMVAGIPPEQVQLALDHLPGRVDLTGKRFGVYRYNNNGHEVEIALPRTDSYDEGERRGQGQINVDHNLPVEKDLERRDFTANSMAVNLDTGKLVDPYGGAEDIATHTLRTTHPNSFNEDPTRLVRALTAASSHGLIPDEKTRKEMAENAPRLDQESPDALKQQLDKLLASPNPSGALRLAHETGVLKHLFPELDNNFDYDQNNPHHNYSLGEHSLNVLSNVSDQTRDPDLRLAALLHDVGKPASAWTDPERGTTHFYPGMVNGQPVGADHAQIGADLAEQRLRDTFNYPVSSLRNVHNLIKQHMFPAFSSPKGARKFLNKAGDAADDLLTLRHGDMTGKGQSPEEIAARTSVAHMRGLVEEARTAQVPTNQSMLAVNGNDLIGLGMKPGPQMGTVLQNLTNEVIENPELNNRETLLAKVQEAL